MSVRENTGETMARAKDEFMKQFGKDYGYPDAPKDIDEIRASEFKRLQGLVYLDHAGATLYSEAQIEAVAKDLTSSVYGNPHSQSDSSLATCDIISAARQQVLDYLNASPKNYRCVFTSGATAALKLIGECFPWSSESCYMYTMENHNSVLGIREYAFDRGAAAVAVDVKEGTCLQNRSHESSFEFLEHTVQRRAHLFQQNALNGKTSGNTYNLFAFPSECNFSGQKFSLDLVNYVKEGGGKPLTGSPRRRGCWMVLIDGAKGCATEPPDLTRYPADFVVFSFYKIFGYPTGLGALVIRSEAAKVLTKTYFSGGTVSASIADVDFIKRRDNIEQVLEDGTISFLAIASIRHGFKIINTLTHSAISRHTASLATYTRTKMMDLKHENGAEVCKIYGRNTSQAPYQDMGPTIAFNLKRADGSWVGYREVEKLASLSGIQLRTGCFCNPGACAKYLYLSHSDLIANFEVGHVCWDDNDILHGKPTGAVRISFGYTSAFEDAEKFLGFLVNSFVEKLNASGDGYPLRMKTDPISGIGSLQLVRSVQLKSITVYPVKSCAGFAVYKWPLSNIGLKYDREWLLKGPTGEILTQKKVPEMCNIRSFIDLECGILNLESPRCKERLHVPIQENSSFDYMEELDIYGQRYKVQCYNDEVNMWFSEAIARRCTLVRCSSSEYRSCNIMGGRGNMCRDTWGKLNFVNEAQLLLVSEESVGDLNSRLNSCGFMSLSAEFKLVQRSNLEAILFSVFTLDFLKDNSGCVQRVLVDAMRFRPNLVISGAEPFAEDDWKSLHIGKARFTSLGGCSRCQMINLDQQSGQPHKAKEPLATLASYRRVQGKILFGILLRHEIKDAEDGEQNNFGERWLQVGQEVYPSIQ
ncbi:molybdenum cofactor sulfurase-like isoform X1 [Musa acuminata AAA Group]|uniref:molybdenum cofactor sulfurase-like isoform X1 n=1 Tax=Musa acuminata AAA Group TaxID=214697 RepID=UPI0031E49865